MFNICTYVYYMILLYLEFSGSKFHSVNTKTSQFSLFFGFQELRKNICIYVHMYICTFVYYMILLYLEGSGSKFHSVNTKTSKFSLFFGFQELRKKHVNAKTSKLPLFLDSRSWEIHVYIYIYVCVYVNYFQLFPRILWVAQLPMEFHLAPKTPVDARNAMFSHQTFVLCSISAPDFCKTRDMYIYIYICMSIQTLFKEDIVFRGTFTFPYLTLYSGICHWFQVSIFPNAPYIYIYICILIYYIIPSSSPKI